MDEWSQRQGGRGLLRTGNQFGSRGSTPDFRVFGRARSRIPPRIDGWTNSFADIRCYDSLHVQATVNQIDGYNHDRSKKVGVPTLFGTNFQAVSVGQKLAVDPVTGLKGGYTDVLGTPGQGAGGKSSISSTSPWGPLSVS